MKQADDETELNEKIDSQSMITTPGVDVILSNSREEAGEYDSKRQGRRVGFVGPEAMDTSGDAEGDHHAEPVAVDGCQGMIPDPLPGDEVSDVRQHEENDIRNNDTIARLVHKEIASTIAG